MGNRAVVIAHAFVTWKHVYRTGAVTIIFFALSFKSIMEIAVSRGVLESDPTEKNDEEQASTWLAWAFQPLNVCKEILEVVIYFTLYFTKVLTVIVVAIVLLWNA